MFGVIGRNPQMLKAIIPVFGSFFAQRLGRTTHPRDDEAENRTDQRLRLLTNGSYHRRERCRWTERRGRFRASAPAG